MEDQIKALKESLVKLENQRQGVNEANLDELGLLRLADICLNQASNNLLLFLLIHHQNRRLHEASKAIENLRRQYFFALEVCEKVVTNYIDAPFSDYEEKLEKITSFSDSRRVVLIQKLSVIIARLRGSPHTDPKWSAALLEASGRVAVIAKNLFDLRSYIKKASPEYPGFYEREAHLRLIHKLLHKVATEFWEMHARTKLISYGAKAVQFLVALKYQEALLGDQEAAEQLGKRIKVWENALRK